MSIEHRVAQGECLESIAFHHGFYWLTLWDHPENAVLRRERPSHDVLAPGDVVFVPDPRPNSVTAETGRRHRFRRRGVPALFVLRLLRKGEPRPNLPYELSVDGDVRAGRTDADGVLRERVPPDARVGRLRLGETEEYVIRFRHLDPVSMPTGLIARLRNLGHLRSLTPDEDVLGGAIARFQRSVSLEPTGIADDETREQLRRAHGN